MSPVPVLHAITRLIVGGAQENTMYTTVMLDKDRFRVDVVSGPQTGSEGSLIDEVRDRGGSLTILPELVREINLWKDVAAVWKLYRLMKAGGFVVVHTHSSKAGVLGRVAARLAGVPIIVHTVHGWSFHDHMKPWLRGMYIALEKLAASVSDAMIVVAERDIRKGLQAGIGNHGQFRLIRSAIPLDEFDPEIVDRAAVRKELGIPSDVPVLGNVGRFSSQKNPLDWVRVGAIVARELPDCHFLLVGDGPLRPEVEELLDVSGIANRTILTGLRRDVCRMLAAMDVFLLTSLWEGLPRVIPQAMAMRVPVVANEVDGTVEVIRHGKTGYLCERGDFGQMAGYCLELLKSSELRGEMGRNGRAGVREEFALLRMLSQIEALYEELLKAKGL